MESCDVLIVGGGPAGSTCARALVAAGLDVILIDKAQFPRDKVCAGWITPAVIDELRLDMDDYRASRVLQPIVGFRTGLLGSHGLLGTERLTRYDRPVSYGIRRCEFDHYLLTRCGARIKEATPLKSLVRSGHHWIVNGEFEAGLVVGAGGHFCPVARETVARETVAKDAVALPPSGPSVDAEAFVASSAAAGTTVVAQETEFELHPSARDGCRVRPDIPELYFCDDLRGYAWCFRKGNFLNIGLGREGESKLSAHVAAFCDWLCQHRGIARDALGKFHGHAYRLYQGPFRRPASDRVLLIGDAAGLAYPQSGEGIRPAIESGLLAADVITSAAGQFEEPLQARLEERLTERFGSRGAPARGTGVLSAARRWAAHRLMSTGWFTRRVLIDRWFLHAHQAPLPRRIPGGVQA
jgi:menaquinone-9 beta-reductase